MKLKTQYMQKSSNERYWLIELCTEGFVFLDKKMTLNFSAAHFV